MLTSPAFAQTAAAAGPQGSFLGAIMPFILILPIFYFLLIRPQQRRLKEHRAMIAAVKKGDMVVTAGGLIGKVTKVADNEVEVELAPSVKVRVVKATLSEVRDPVAAPANDSSAG